MNQSTEKENTDFKVALGQNILSLRGAAKLSQSDLAERAGLTRVTVADVERGTANPSLDVLAAIANALGIKVTDLFSQGITHQSAYILQPLNGNLFDPLVNQLSSVQNGEANIQVAYAKSSGVDLLTSSLKAFHTAGGRIRVIVGIDQKNTTAEALYKLMILCDELYVVHDKAFAQTYHPKIYIVKNNDQAWVGVGSNNLTRGGLCVNYEACHTQLLNLSDYLDRRAYETFLNSFSAYLESNIVKHISGVDDISTLLSDGLIVTEQQSRQNVVHRSSFTPTASFGHRSLGNIPSVTEKVAVPAGTFSTLPLREIASRRTTMRPSPAPASANEDILNDSEITADSLFSLDVAPDMQATFWFEMRASTGGSRNILDLSSSAKLQGGANESAVDGVVPGGVTFFGLDPKAHDTEKNITIVYNGISYYPSTIKFAPNNASWRIQLKGDAETGDGSLSLFGRTDFANHILIFHRVTQDLYVLETMAERELDTLKENSVFWATNGNGKTSKAFGQILIGHE